MSTTKPRIDQLRSTDTTSDRPIVTKGADVALDESDAQYNAILAQMGLLGWS